jgi:hypothetical protein
MLGPPGECCDVLRWDLSWPRVVGREERDGRSSPLLASLTCSSIISGSVARSTNHRRTAALALTTTLQSEPAEAA